MHTGPSGRREAFSGPLLAAWLGQRVLPGQQLSLLRLPGANRCIRPQLLRPRTSPGLPVPTRTQCPQSRANRTEHPGEQGFGSNCRRAVRGAAPLAGVKALPPVPAQEAARRQRRVTAFHRLGPRELFRVFSCCFHLRSAVATLMSSLCFVSGLRKPVNFGANTNGSYFPSILLMRKKPRFLTREFLMIRSFKSQLGFHAPSRPEERLSPASEARLPSPAAAEGGGAQCCHRRLRLRTTWRWQDSPVPTAG